MARKLKKFLVGIVIIIIASIGFNLKPDKRDQAVVVQEEPVVKKEEVITYKELLEYLDIFKTGDIINIENTSHLSHHLSNYLLFQANIHGQYLLMFLKNHLNLLG